MVPVGSRLLVASLCLAFAAVATTPCPETLPVGLAPIAQSAEPAAPPDEREPHAHHRGAQPGNAHEARHEGHHHAADRSEPASHAALRAPCPCGCAKLPLPSLGGGKLAPTVPGATPAVVISLVEHPLELAEVRPHARANDAPDPIPI